MKPYAKVTVFVPCGELFGELDDLIRARCWPHRVEYPFERVEGVMRPTFVAVNRANDQVMPTAAPDEFSGSTKS